MSMIKCPECDREISDKAVSCPNCGCPIKETKIETEQEKINVRRKNKGEIFIFFGVISFIFSIYAYNTTSKRIFGLSISAFWGISAVLIIIGIVFWLMPHDEK